MKNRVFLFLCIVVFLQGYSQNNKTSKNSNLNLTRQGFGRHSGIGLNLGFVNSNGIIEGTPYYFDEWNTEGVIFTKKDGRFKIKKVNINLFNNTVETIYEGNKVFTFDSKNLIRIVIDGKIFRIFEVDKDVKIFELLFKGGGFSIYKYQSIIYAEKAKNPMLIRTTNKYIRKNKYYSYKSKELSRLKLSKKKFAEHFKSSTISEKEILDFIKRNKISLKNEADFIKTLKFVTQ